MDFPRLPRTPSMLVSVCTGGAAGLMAMLLSLSGTLADASGKKASASRPAGGVPSSRDARVPSWAAGDVLSQHRAFRLLTEKPLMNPEVPTELCRPVYQKMEASHGPHSTGALAYYVNPEAARALEQKAATFPPGSRIVKEKLSRTRGDNPFQVTGIGGMIKRAPGYDPAHGDWEFYYADAKTPLTTGRLTACAECHLKARPDDYVFQVRDLPEP